MSAQRLSERERDEFFARHFKIGHDGLIEEHRYCSGTLELGPSELFSEYGSSRLAEGRPLTIAEAWRIVEAFERAAS